MSEHNKPVDFDLVDFDTFNHFVTLDDSEMELAIADARARRDMNRDENESR